MNLRQLAQFVDLAETGNFHRTAERLHMAQPPLSVSIRKLEDELGGALFDRTPAGVVLTAAGQAMLADARQALAHAAQCRQRVTAALHGLGGLLRVVFIGTATYSLLPRLIPSFRAHYPKIELELTESTTQAALDGLAAGRLDVGLVRYPVLTPGDCEFTVLERDEFMLAVPGNSPLARRSAIALSAVAQEPFILYEQARVPGLFALAMLRCQHSGFSPRVAQQAMQVATILSLVESGLGLALVAGVARHQMRRGVKLLRLTDTPADARLDMALATRPDHGNQLVSTFAAHAMRVAQEATDAP
jgi:DNA-binding transcriptional LysR family regulator